MKIFAESKELKQAKNELNKINKLEEKIKALTDEQLKEKTSYFKERISKGATLDDIKIEAFAVAREATFRVLQKRPFDVQLIGGLILNAGSVAEMKTGEGKTIASVAPAYLNALSGENVLISTVNEYLTVRDAEEMGEVHQFLGLTVGINTREKSPEDKRAAYACDITYSVHSEIGFDYLRDNMVSRIEDKVQRSFNFCLIDEVDSILIDEAKTPLIISGGSEETSSTYKAADQFVKSLKKDDYEIDWESKSIQLVDKGVKRANQFFGVKNIFAVTHSDTVHRIQNSLRANYVMFRDADYIVNEGKILIVDAFTGRVMEGRSFSDGLHQAIQAKEDVEIEPETKTLATITYQNLFRMFKKLSGMTGTAKTEEGEFLEIYNMRVNSIATNRPMIRKDHPDAVYVTSQAKYKAIVKEIKRLYDKKQPILVGTEEVSESEKVSKMLSKVNIPHTVLNAKQNQSEAEIIASAGAAGSITIATNMAGRGTDIKPDPLALKNGGLYVLGTNKAESRRIDNQLRGRSGRQGDVGESKFFLSLDDKLISRFSNQTKLKKAFSASGDNPIKGNIIVKALNRAQKKIEGFNYDSRKNVLQYDDVIRQQRDLIYAQRDIIIGKPDLAHVIERMSKSVVNDLISDKNFKAVRAPDGSLDIKKLVSIVNKVWFQLSEIKVEVDDVHNKTSDEIKTLLGKYVVDAYYEIRDNIVENTSEEIMHQIERQITLKVFDDNWQLHIDKMSKLKTGSSMASYAQKNPFQVYIEKGNANFEDMLKRISHNTIKLIMSNRYSIKVKNPEDEILKTAIKKAIED